MKWSEGDLIIYLVEGIWIEKGKKEKNEVYENSECNVKEKQI